MTSSEQPKYRISFILLAIVFIVSFSLHTFAQWLEDSVSYGNLNLSFTSETLDFSVDIMHQKGKFYLAVPERRFCPLPHLGELKRSVNVAAGDKPVNKTDGAEAMHRSSDI